MPKADDNHTPEVRSSATTWRGVMSRVQSAHDELLDLLCTRRMSRELREELRAIVRADLRSILDANSRHRPLRKRDVTRTDADPQRRRAKHLRDLTQQERDDYEVLRRKAGYRSDEALAIIRRRQHRDV